MATLRQRARPPNPRQPLISIYADPVFSADDSRVKVPWWQWLRPVSRLRPEPQLDRLPFSLREAETIRAIAPPGQVVWHLGLDATKDSLMAPAAGQPRILHLATHAMVNDTAPESSWIALSLVDGGGAPREGTLFLNEIFTLNLNTELVVLSACSTGLGKLVAGEGLWGFSRAFFHAGAQRLLISLWPVDDAATAELVGDFYKGLLADHLRPSSALLAARRGMWAQSRWRDPYLWSGFTLTGEID